MGSKSYMIGVEFWEMRLERCICSAIGKTLSTSSEHLIDGLLDRFCLTCECTSLSSEKRKIIWCDKSWYIELKRGLQHIEISCFVDDWVHQIGSLCLFAFETCIWKWSCSACLCCHLTTNFCKFWTEFILIFYKLWTCLAAHTTHIRRKQNLLMKYYSNKKDYTECESSRDKHTVFSCFVGYEVLLFQQWKLH